METVIESQLIANINEYQEQVLRISILAEDLSILLSEEHTKDPDAIGGLIHIAPGFIKEVLEINIESMEVSVYLNTVESFFESVSSLIKSNINNLHNKGLMKHLRNCYNTILTATKAEILNKAVDRMILEDNSDPEIA